MARTATALALLAIVARSSAQATIAANATGTCSESASNPNLVNVRCPWPYSGPEKLDTSDGPRGIMTGYNRCNATTQNQNSLCVNAVANNISDFCVFGSPSLNTIANVEGETVAYCTNPGYGTRLIPQGTITGLQMVKTPGYIAYGGFWNGPNVGIIANDTGGELDPHGADNRGNPIGSLFYSTAFSANNATYLQAAEWNVFVSGYQFCMKVCNPNYSTPNGNLCQNQFDTIGCNGNVPLNYGAINGTFTSCQGEVQQVPNGSALPVPATSACVTYASTALFGAATSSAAVSSASAASASSGAMSGSSAASMMTSAPSAGSLAGQVSSSTTAKAGAAVVGSSLPVQGGLLVLGAAVIGAAAVLL